MKARELLEQMAAAKDLMNRDGHRVHNFERWLLDNGEPFDELLYHEPFGLGFGEPKMCFSNAARAVLNFEVDSDEWFYTEGVVAFEDLPLDIHHAWLSNREGRVLDLTSRHAHEVRSGGVSYWGVPFTADTLREQVLRNQIYGLFSDGVRYLPVTHEPVPDAIRAWPRELRKEAA